VSTTGDEPEKLRARQEEVEYLGEEEQEQSLGEVSLNADDGESHPVSNKGCLLESPSGVPSHTERQPQIGRPKVQESVPVVIQEPVQTPTKGSMK